MSQQEKLENFVSNSGLLYTEMVWQQRLGQTSKSLKFFANSWDFISWINMALIWVINAVIILSLEWQKGKDGEFKPEPVLGEGDRQQTVSTLGAIQTGCALFVLVSYYIEYKASFKFKI